VGALFTYFWLTLGTFPPVTAVSGGTLRLEPGSVWQDLHQNLLFPIALLALVGIALACVNLFRPYWTRIRLAVRAAVNFVSAVILLIIVSAHWTGVKAQLAKVTGPSRAATGIEAANNWINISMGVPVLVAAIVYAVEFIRGARRILKNSA
jgi:hypothetical protein